MKELNEKIPVAIYIRGKIKKQEDEDVFNKEEIIKRSLLEQEEEIRDYCREKNYRIIGVYQDNPHEYWGKEDVKSGLKKLLIDSFDGNFKKVIMIDLYNIDIDKNNSAYYIGVISNNDIDIEIIHSGTYLEDFDFDIKVNRNDLEIIEMKKAKKFLGKLTKEKSKLRGELGYYKLLVECIAKSLGDILDEYDNFYDYLMKVPEDFDYFKEGMESSSPLFMYIFQMFINLYAEISER